MRIMLVCRGYPTQRPGGMLFVCQDRARELARQGHDVHVITTGLHSSTATGIIQDQGVTVHHLACKPLAYTNEFSEGCTGTAELLKPDVIHLDSFDRARPWWIDRPGAPKVIACTMHGLGFGGFLTKWNMFRAGKLVSENFFTAFELKEEAELLASFDRVFAVSRHEALVMADFFGLLDVQLVYNPIGQCFYELPLTEAPAEGPFLCAAVSGHGERGFDLARRAAEMVGVELRVAQNLNRGEMPALLDQCRGVVLPTYYAQGFDLVVCEAAARHRAVIASATGSYAAEACWYKNPRFACIARGGMQHIKLVPVGDTAMLSEAMFTLEDKITEWPGDIFTPASHVGRWLKALGSEIYL